MAEVKVDPVPAPQSTPSIDSSDDEKKALLTRLDELLEKYLNTLHEYQKAGEQLSKCFSSGYLSLAQANFHNSSTTTRYGQDCYDERMQAIRNITINASSLDDSSPDTQRLSFSVSSLSNGNGKPKEGVSEKQDDHPTPSESESKPESEPEKKTTNPVRDPIRWFGILVPQALRSAQASFIQAVEGPIPELATVARELRGLEVEIGRVRKQIKKL